MKVMFFCNDLPFFLNHFSTLLSRTIDLGYQVTVVAGGSNAKALDDIEKFGAKFISINMTRSGTNLFSEMKVLFEIRSIFKKINPDVIHLLTIKPCIYGGLISRVLRIKTTIGTVTGLGYIFSSKSGLAKIRSTIFIGLYRLAFGLSNHGARLVFENSDDRNYFTKNRVITVDRTEKVWGAGVNLKLFSPANEKFKRKDAISLVKVLLPSRMLKDKGVVEFFEAAKIIKSLQLPIEMILVGGIDPHNPASFTQSELVEYVDKGFVQWRGFQSDMPMQLRTADIICLPSYREGMPKVLLEAMACGKPIITTDVPGCREVIINEVHGLLIPARDGQSLADAIIKIASSQQLIDTMGQYSRQRALQLFSDLNIAEQYINLYK